MTTEPTWLQLGRKDIGIREAPGIADNAVIIGWARSIGYKIGYKWVAAFYQHDSIPWCGLWLAHVFYDDGKQIPPAGKVLGALNWCDWGQPIAVAVPGAVLVFKREGGGHVGIYVREDATCYHVLAGNQGDMVCIVRIDKLRCVARRWPFEIQPFGQPIIAAASNAPISRNEA